MARPKKSGLSYFPLDVDFFEDPKIKILRARYGRDGIVFYIYLLCEIYRQGYYIQVDDDFEYIIRKINDVILFEFDTDDVRCFDKNLRIIFQTKRYLILEDDYSRTKIAYNAAVLKFLKELGA